MTDHQPMRRAYEYASAQVTEFMRVLQQNDVPFEFAVIGGVPRLVVPDKVGAYASQFEEAFVPPDVPFIMVP